MNFKTFKKVLFQKTFGLLNFKTFSIFDFFTFYRHGQVMDKNYKVRPLALLIFKTFSFFG